MPEAEDDVLQRICEEVERERHLSPVERRWLDVFRDYAKAVARRYAATVGAGVPSEEGIQAGLRFLERSGFLNDQLAPDADLVRVLVRVVHASAETPPARFKSASNDG